MKVLERNPPKGELEKMFELRENLNERRMAENDGKGFKATKEVFEGVLAKFKANNKRSYDFLIKASQEFKDSVYILCKRIIERASLTNSEKQRCIRSGKESQGPEKRIWNQTATYTVKNGSPRQWRLWLSKLWSLS